MSLPKLCRRQNEYKFSMAVGIILNIGAKIFLTGAVMPPFYTGDNPVYATPVMLPGFRLNPRFNQSPDPVSHLANILCLDIYLSWTCNIGDKKFTA